MSTETASGPVTLLTQRQNDWLLPQRALKRKFDFFQPSTRQGLFCYPSPPMSSPPSPPGPPQELPRTAPGEPVTSVPLSTIAAVSSASGLRALVPTARFVQPPPPIPYPPPFPAQPTGFTGLQGPVFGVLQRPGSTGSGPTVTAGSGISASSSNRTGRKSKAHVASACVNCKRAHLSCDVQRPCERCVASGKQSTCIDVQHKKRGRPRLREEGGFKMERMLPEQGMQSAGLPIAGPSTARPIAGTRHRRTDSLRSLRSQASDGSSVPALLTPSFPPPPAPPPNFSLHQPPPPGASVSPDDVPTAYLDLDLVFIRANHAFQHVTSGGVDIRGRRLGDVAAPADNENFQSVRNWLRSEREAREPAYMPPIMQPGHDPLHGISEADVDRLTQSFTDRTYRWTRSQPGSTNETFPARVRLAKAAIYFVVVTLPSFHPRPAYPPSVTVAPFAVPHSLATTAGYPPLRQGISQSAPPAFYHPFPSAGGPLALEQLPIEPARTYPPYPPQQAYSPYQQPPPPTTPRSAIEPPTDVSPFTPQSVFRETMRPPETPVQLPPMASAPVGPSSVRMAEAQTPIDAQTHQLSSSEEEGEEGDRLRSPKKRRRVGIYDVLQR